MRSIATSRTHGICCESAFSRRTGLSSSGTRALISTVRPRFNQPSAMSHTYTRLSLLTKHISNGKVRVLMLILSEFDIRFQVPAPAAMVVVLHLHPSLESRLRTGNGLLIERSTTDVPDPTNYSRTIVPYSEYFDSFGNRCARFIASAGYLRLSNTSVIDADPEPDRILCLRPTSVDREPAF